jgi:hypothetical protein
MQSSDDSRARKRRVADRNLSKRAPPLGFLCRDFEKGQRSSKVGVLSRLGMSLDIP